MKVFVTGGSGFIGGHIIESLVARGDEVRAMARSARSAAIVEGYGAQASQCSLGAVPMDALDDIDVVVHCAGFVEQWGTREQFEEGNVEGTRQLLDVARRAGVSRFVFISSEAALFDDQDLIDADEATPYPARHRFLYPETKARAEQLVREANSEGFETISLRPRLVWGPRDTSVLPAVLEMIEQGSFAWIDGGRIETSTTHVTNLCHAVALAIDHAPGGSTYFVCDDERHTFRSFMTALLETQDISPTRRSVPAWALRPVAGLVEMVWRATGQRSAPPLHRFTVSLMSHHCTLDDSKIRDELGYVPVVSFEQGLNRLVLSERGSRAA